MLTKECSFRKSEKYIAFHNSFAQAISNYFNNSGVCDGLEELMLLCYKQMEYIKKQFYIQSSYKKYEQFELDTAIMELVRILDQTFPPESPTYQEVEALEKLSLMAYKTLVEFGEIKPSIKQSNFNVYCHKCFHFHIPPVDDSCLNTFTYCHGCRGYLESKCKVHT